MEARIELNQAMKAELEVAINKKISHQVTDYKVKVCSNAITVEVYDHEMHPLPITNFTVGILSWDFQTRKWYLEQDWNDITEENGELAMEEVMKDTPEQKHFDLAVEEEETLSQYELEQERLAQQHEELWP